MPDIKKINEKKTGRKKSNIKNVGGDKIKTCKSFTKQRGVNDTGPRSLLFCLVFRWIFLKTDETNITNTVSLRSTIIIYNKVNDILVK